MKKILKYISVLFVVLISHYSCVDKNYSLGDLTAPADIVINTDIIGATTAKPNGDGSGDVKINITATNALGYKVGYNVSGPTDLVYSPSNSFTKKFTSVGLNTYRITVVVFGKGGTSSTLTKDVTVQFDYTPADATIIPNLTGGSSKTWIVDKSVPGHLGVGPFTSTGSDSPIWWSAGVNEKVSTANCFYTATFTFNKVGTSFTLQVTNPDGAFTKTGTLTTLPGIPDSGAEGCYPYSGGTSAFSFIPASSGIAATTPSTQTSIQLAGNATYIGYGAVQKEYEILVLTSTYMYLRVQGTETGNAWYMKLKAQ